MNEPRKMLFDTNTKSSLESENRRAYDTAFKNFFKRKAVLAIMLKEIIPEYKDLLPSDIELLIQSSDVNQLNAETLSEEDTTFCSKVLYDIVVSCKLPESEECVNSSIIFDLEMQRKFNMPYDILDRATYYASRLLAKQSVKDSKYDTLVPVYSTWVCLSGIPKEYQNTIHNFRLQNVSDSYYPSRKSLINIDLLLLSEHYDWDVTDNTLIKFLQAIFKDRLQDASFNPFLNVDNVMQKEVQVLMAEQSQYDYELQIEREQAAKEGREAGMAEGRAEGENRFAALTAKLIELGALADLKKASESKEYREELYKRFYL